MAYEQDLNSLYQKYYGRDADQGETDANRGNPGGLSAIEQMLKGSLPPTADPSYDGSGTGPRPPATPPPPGKIWTEDYPGKVTPAQTPVPLPTSQNNAVTQNDPDGRSTGTDDRAWFASLIGGLGGQLTPEQLSALAPQLAQRGFTVVTSANGKAQKIRNPQGLMIDVIQGADTGMNKSQWLQSDAPGQPGGPRVGGSAGGGSSWTTGGSSGGYSSSSSTGAGAPAGVSQQLYDMLLARAKQGTAVDHNDPNIRQQVDPYAAQVERERRNYLADAAESGGPLVNLQGEKRVSAEKAGQATGLFESTLIGKEIAAKRDEIQAALTQLGSQLSEDQRQALQKELAYLNDATQRYGIDAQSQIAQGQLGLGYGQLGLGYGNLNLGQSRLGLDTSELDWRMDPRNPANL